jgi:hypothetical protein
MITNRSGSNSERALALMKKVYEPFLAPFRDVDFEVVKEAMHSPIIFDGRNQLDREMLVEMGFDYFGIGR